jgi:hypothetical protein
MTISIGSSLRHWWPILPIAFLLASVLSIFFVPYGNGSFVNCPLLPFSGGCTTVRGAVPLVGYLSQVIGPFSLALVALAVLLGITIFGLVLPWALVGADGAVTSVTAWSIFVEFACTLGRWFGLRPSWGYALVTVCLWGSLASALIRRAQVASARDAAWVECRRSAEERARQAREEEIRDRQAWERAQRSVGDRAGHSFGSAADPEDAPSEGVAAGSREADGGREPELAKTLRVGTCERVDPLAGRRVEYVGPTGVAVSGNRLVGSRDHQYGAADGHRPSEVGTVLRVWTRERAHQLAGRPVINVGMAGLVLPRSVFSGRTDDHHRAADRD